jgi:hypothetical protein
MSRLPLVFAAALLGAILLLLGWSMPGQNELWAAPPAAAEDPFAQKAAGAQPERPKPAQPAAQESKRSKSAAQSKGKKSQIAQAAPAAGFRAGKEAIEKALVETTSLEFVDTPLQDVVDFLKNKHAVQIVLDKKAMDDVGLSTDTPITMHLGGVTLRSGLKLMLRELDLTWIIDNEVLLITTPEEANSRLTTEMYDVGDLVTCRDENNELWEDYHTLIDVITPTVQPTTWDCVGGPGSICGATFSSAKLLVVSQTQEVHEEIVALLGKLRGFIEKSGRKAEPPRRDRPAPEKKGGFDGSGPKHDRPGH